MKFNEFYNKQKNVIKASIAKRIESNIPITEERDAFYKGELFKKYDIVESSGRRYTILEQASNYYHVVDQDGNLSRKFAKQLTKVSNCTEALIGESFHSYKIESQAAKDFMLSSFSVEKNNDDVGILKYIKKLDEKMDNTYKSKDKLTVAKIIADAVGIKHDLISSPENLVNAAIRKARKDPKIIKNKEILSNMLSIAREVGIKFTDDTFSVQEAIEVEPMKETEAKDSVLTLSKLRQKLAANSAIKLPPMADEVKLHQGHTLNPNSNTHRKQLIQKLRHD